jgi:predicted Zn finger-like uncharacterized protein
MKATCPSCSTSYKVADEKVPEAGAQIKCPKCNTLFVVRRSPEPPKPESTPEPAVGHEQSTPMHVLTGESPPPTAPAAPEPEPKAPDAKPAVRARGVSAIRAQSGVKAQAPLTDAYRVRTQKGLTYDFSTREAMVRWLKERDDLTGCEASEPGGDWHPAHEFIGTVPLEGEAETPAAPGVVPPPRPAPAPRPRLVPRPISPQTGVFMWLALGLTTLLVILIAAATLTRYGVVDFSSVLPLEAVGIQVPGKTRPMNPSEAPESADLENPEKVFNRAINQARQSIQAKRFSKAALEYNRALSVRPKSVEALEGLARAYSGLGDRDRADAVLEKVKALKGE